MAPEAMTLVRTTVATEAQAVALATALVEERKAACAHVVPLTSVYRWQGRMERAQEWLVEARVLPAQAEAALARLRQGHPYELPLVEQVATAVDAAYADWARQESAGPA